LGENVRMMRTSRSGSSNCEIVKSTARRVSGENWK
jgi:hypothetical protein